MNQSCEAGRRFMHSEEPRWEGMTSAELLEEKHICFLFIPDSLACKLDPNANDNFR